MWNTRDAKVGLARREGGTRATGRWDSRRSLLALNHSLGVSVLSGQFVGEGARIVLRRERPAQHAAFI